MQIKQKLTLGFVTVALLVAIVGYISVSASQKALQKPIGKSSVSLAVELLDKIDRDIFNKIERFQSFQDPSLQETIIKSNREFGKLDNIQNYIDEKDREWTSVPKEEITPFMQDLINNRLSKALRKRAKFYEEKYGFKVYPEVFVTNKYGANVGQTGKTSDYFQGDEQWWQNAKENGLYVADVEYDESAAVYSTDIGIRIDDEDGNFIGVTKVILNIEEVINIIKEAEKVAEAGKVVICETEEFRLLVKGRIIYDSAEEYEFFEGVFDKEFFREITKDTGYLLKKGEHGEGAELFAYAHSKGYRDYKGLGWILVVEHETEEIFAPVAKLKNVLLTILLAATALAVLIGLFISRSISAPLTTLKHAVDEISKGKLDTKIDIQSNDEIGQLAASFNDMARKLEQFYERLRESHAHLEEQVQERTAELSATSAKLAGEMAHRWSEKKQLTEHVKELDCLYSLSKLVEQPEISLEQIFQETANLIRNAYQHPEVTCVGLTFDGARYKTDNFEESEFSQHAQINVHEDKAGAIEVYYLGGPPENGKDPFLKGEHNLLNAVAERLGRITERNQAEEKLKQVAGEWTSTFNSITDFVSIHDKNFKFIRVNKALADVLKMNPEEIIGKTCYELIHGTKEPPSFCPHKKTLDTKEPARAEFFEPHLGVYLEMSTSPVFDENSEIIGTTHIAKDITERRQAEQALETLNEQLQTTVRKLTLANQELNDFTHMAAHDLKTALQAIGILADWISTDYADKFDKQGRERVRLLLRRAERVSKLIDGISEYSDIGRTRHKQEKVDLNILLRELIAEVEPLQNIEITVENELPVLECEKIRITQVFGNLLGNAVKYTDKPEGRIRIGCIEENGFWKFSVADNGPGIEEKYFEKIFKIFQTLSSRDEIETAGIGLAVAKKIVELYDGKIWVESEAGKGSTFYFTLPK